MSDNNDVKAEEIQSTPGAESSAETSEVGDRAVRCEAREAVLEEKVAELENRIKVLEEENSALKDQYLRKQADFENYRKRMQREKQETVQFANKQLLLDIVPVLDDFERAIKSGEESQDFTAFHDGILLIEKQFSGLLERKWGLKRFDSVGEVFDPQKHEAITAENRNDHETSMVVEDYQKGYFLHDKVLRTAKVKVSLPVPGEGDDNTAPDSSDASERAGT